MRTYKIIFRDSEKRILAIETVDCLTVSMAVTLASDNLYAKHGSKILADARMLSVEEQ